LTVDNIKLKVESGAVSVTVTASPQETATEQVRIAEHQRVLGIIPSFMVVYDRNPAPLTAKLKFQLAFRVAVNIVHSDYTTPELYPAGASRGAVDPCYPSKIGIAHVYNLLAVKHSKKPLHAIWFPMYDVLPTPLVNLTGSNACPTVTATPNAVKAAFTKDLDENKPSRSIRIRVETIDHFLRRYREDIIERHKKEKEIESRLEALRRSLERQEQDPDQLAMAGD
jgi:predicted nucleotide-binding protein (sugar kinase/HSP70/actin superfamily)